MKTFFTRILSLIFVVLLSLSILSSPVYALSDKSSDTKPCTKTEIKVPKEQQELAKAWKAMTEKAVKADPSIKPLIRQVASEVLKYYDPPNQASISGQMGIQSHPVFNEANFGPNCCFYPPPRPHAYCCSYEPWAFPYCGDCCC